MANEQTITVLPAQATYINAAEREVLGYGGFGSSKSRGLCIKAFARASVPGAVELMCRKTLVAFKKTTLRTLTVPEGNMPPVLPLGSYEHNKTEGIISIKGGGTIMYFGLDNPEKVGAINATGAHVDECVEATIDDWIMLLGRIRLKVDGVTRQINGVCNPSAPSHWLVEHFGITAGHACPEGRRAIHVPTADNWFLPEDYLQSLRELTGVRRKRFYEGQWVGSDGLVYDKWNRDIHVKARSSPWARSLVCWDDGYTNPFAALLVHLDGDGRMHIEREVYRSKMQREDKIAAVLDLGGPGCEAPGDEASPELIQAMRDNGSEARGVSKSAKKVFEGITQFVQPRLLVAGDGEPRLTVDPSCENVIREMETYEWKSGKDGHAKDEPVKEHDHAMDALRYGVLHVDNAPKVGVTVKPRARRGRGGFNGRL